MINNNKLLASAIHSSNAPKQHSLKIHTKKVTR